jgi:hypothetical protein
MGPYRQAALAGIQKRRHGIQDEEDQMHRWNTTKENREVVIKSRHRDATPSLKELVCKSHY